jgi:hypothetical protein
METKQILQAFNTWHKILEPKQMEANITSLQLIIDGTQNPQAQFVHKILQHCRFVFFYIFKLFN